MKKFTLFSAGLMFLTCNAMAANGSEERRPEMQCKTSTELKELPDGRTVIVVHTVCERPLKRAE